MNYQPHEYQQYCEDRIIKEPNLGLLLEMGLGKTVITLSAIKRLKFDMFQIRRVLVIAPLKVAEATWTNEAAKWDHLRDLRFSLILGSAEQRLAALSQTADIYVINRDNVVWLISQLRQDWPFDMLVVDELSSFKNASAKRFRALKAALPRFSRVVGLTGTPAPNGIQDLWAQIYLLDRGQRLGRTLTAYREQYFKHNPWTHEYTPVRGAVAQVQAKITDICVSLTAADYIKMPDVIIDDIPVQLDSEARATYRTLEQTMLLEVDGETITAASAAVLTGKLLQLCSGAVYLESGDAAVFHDCKLEALTELIEGLNGEPALLFYGFVFDIERLTVAIRKLNPALRVRKYEGAKDADAWNAGEVDILLAHPASCAYGLNLQQGGHHIIFFTPPWSLELYQQANARLHRQGQEHPVIIHRLLVKGGMDEQVTQVLDLKCGTQDALMDALKARINKVRTEA